MMIKFVDDEVVFEPPAFRDVLDRMDQAAASIEDHSPSRPNRQTGPRTQAGKDNSKRNSTRHGLSGKGTVLPPTVQAEVDATIARLTVQFQPQDDVDHDLIRQCAVGYAQQFEAISQQTMLLTLRSEQAAAEWDSIRREDVQEIAARLRKNPGLTTAQLQRSTPGVLWLLEQWKHLYRAIKNHGEWSRSEQELAQDLAGLLPSLRDHDPLHAQKGTADQRIALVRKEVKFLRSLVGDRRDSVERLERLMVMEGFIPAAGTEYRRLKRYEREARNLSNRAYQALEARRLERLARDRDDDNDDDQDDEPIARRLPARSGSGASPAPSPAPTPRPTTTTPRVVAPRPPRPILTPIDVMKAVTGPNPSQDLLRRFEQEYGETAKAAEPTPAPTAKSSPSPSPSPSEPVENRDRPKRAPRDHELDAEALVRREQRRMKRKCKQNRR